MIKFFRKIRQKMLTENKFSKYLIYAIGEIILVVIGILIALSINNWNENSNQDKLELEALKNLREDFNFNLSELIRIDSVNTKNIKSCVQILNHTGKRYTEEFILEKHLNAAAASPDYSAKNGFLNDLISSGNLGLIKNSVLRNLLSSWLTELSELTLREEASQKTDFELIDFIIKNGSYLDVDEIVGFNNNLNLKLPKSGFEIDNNQMLKMPEFENRIENQIIFFNIATEKYKDCMNLNKEILQLLESEIKTKK
ncbi:hypothetical protein FEE95_01065 [Maribacter algarum]|uniref:Uncharacterized protein n=1 Tax=Maribacter algarum (ex Zhang et al. 2020) TaxID=2578118 RepID=A0A5S3PXP8_9FLAO|nr:DUF6090 family protein [Maribacter algarum]TMM58047.1 hypothetical protein FEE95_01065 [Maribacter algarum]